mmetsp:Transcript_7802/g.23020  ORF Transcript_7802/g.23020 Transcript_7802/m.23020 type:complete len:286 (+) Transcript_7802:3-860(+)
MADHDNHYQAVAKVYSLAVFYDPTGPFVKWQKARLAEIMQLKPGDSLADVGGGTGQFALNVATAAGLKPTDVMVVEPSAAMLFGEGEDEEAGGDNCDDAKPGEPARIHLGAQEWCNLAVGAAEAGPAAGFGCVLLKEMVHHLDVPLPGLFRAMRERRLAEGGRVVIVTRPQTDTDYPFFDGAQKVWEENQPSSDSIMAALADGGFADVRKTVLRYPLAIKTDEWCTMVENRFWSTFSHFTDEELRAGTDVIRRNADGSDTLQFEERTVVITASMREYGDGEKWMA